jgi:hypothetical protein
VLLSYGNIYSELERVRNFTEGLNKTTETFSWDKCYSGQDLEAQMKDDVLGKIFSQKEQ